MKTTMLLRLFAIVLLLASLALNVYFLTADRNSHTSAAPEPSAVQKEKETAQAATSPAPRMKQKLHWRKSSYDSYEKNVQVHFSTGCPVFPGNNDVTITPALPFRLEQTYDGFAVNAAFRPETEYSFRIRRGIADEKQAKLDYDVTFRIQIPPLETSVAFLTRGPYFPAGRKNTKIPIRLVNVKKLSYTLSRYYKNNLPAFHLDNWLASGKRREIARGEWKIDIPKNTETTYPLDLAAIIRNREAGVYHLEIRGASGASGADSSDSASTEIVLSDLSLQCVTDVIGRRARAVVRNLNDGSPVSGAEVELWTAKNQKIGSATTGNDGIAEILFSPDFNDPSDRPLMILAEKEGDLTFCDLRGSHKLPVEEGRVNPVSNRMRALLYTERGVCRPGESVTASFFLRNPRLEPVKNTPVVLTVSDPMGREFLRRELKTDESGFASAKIAVPENGRSGRYTLRVSQSGEGTNGISSLIVSNYMPDRIRADLTELASPAVLLPETPLSFAIRASYYFGADPGNTPCRLTLRAGASHHPAAWKDYTVGDSAKTAKGRSYSVSGTLEKGAALVTYPGFGKQGIRFTTPFFLEAEAEVREPGGRAVTVKKQYLAHPVSCYFGLRQKNGNAAGFDTPEIEWQLLSADPKKHPAEKKADFQYSLFRLEWNYVLRETNGTFKRLWEREEIPVKTGRVKADAFSGVIPLGKQKPGLYAVVAEDASRRTRLEFWHSAGEGGVRSSNPAELVFRTDKSRYLPGETARVTFRSPGAGHAFLTVGGRAIDWMRAFPVRPGDNTLEVPLPADLRTSSCFAGVTLLAGGTRLFGFLTLNVDQEKHRIHIELAAPETASPEETVTIEAKLTDTAKRPVDALVQLYAVDAGILSLTDYQVPDIFSFFYGKYRCPWQFSDIFGMIFPDLRIGRDGKIGGDKAMAPSAAMRSSAIPDGIRKETPAVFVLEAARTDRDGRIFRTVKLPRHTGAMRIMAVASADDKAGSASRELVMRDKASILATAPRATAPGDELELTYTVFNHSLPLLSGPFTVAAPESFGILSAKQHTVKGIRRGESETIRVRVKAGNRPGCGVFRATLGTLVCETPVTIRNANPPVTSTAYHVLRPGETLRIAPRMEEWASDDTETTIRLSASPSLAASDAQAFLNNYPYGCLEQTVAGAFPYLGVEAMKKCGLVTEQEASSVEAKLENAAGKVLSLMLHNGAFCMWPGGNSAWESASVFASHFLIEGAQKKNLPLDRDARNRICAHLASLASDAAQPRGLRGYAVYVLALANRSEALRNARNLLAGADPDFASFLAGAALIRAGYAGEGGEAMRQALDAEVWRETGAPYAFADEAARCGMVLAILSDILPESPHAPRIADALRSRMRTDGSGWGVTQANTWALLGLASYSAGAGSGASHGILAYSTGRRAHFDTKQTQTLRLAPKESVEVRNTGNAPVHVLVTTRGVPKQARSLAGALKLSKVYRNEKGEALSRFRHGELVTVTLTLESSGPLDNVVVSDLLPGGLEIEDDLLATRAGAPAQNPADGLRINCLEKGRERFLLFGDILSKGRHVFSYRTRAVSRGKYAIPALHAEGMYEPDAAGTFATETVLEIE